MGFLGEAMRRHMVFGPVTTNRETEALVPSTQTTGAL
jgi:hypothetical protein